MIAGDKIEAQLSGYYVDNGVQVLPDSDECEIRCNIVVSIFDRCYCWLMDAFAGQLGRT